MATAYDASGGWHYLAIAGSDYPLMFSLHGSMAEDPRKGPQPSVLSILRAQPAAASMAPEAQFRFGFDLGMSYWGIDLALGGQRVIPWALHYHPASAGLVMPIKLAGQATRMMPCDARIRFPPGLSPEPFLQAAGFGFCELCLFCARLHMTDHPAAGEIVISFLTRDWSDLGLKGYEFEDCRDALMHYGPELLDEVMLSLRARTVSPLEYGLNLGRAVFEMMNTIISWRHRNGVAGYYSKADFLRDLGG